MCVVWTNLNILMYQHQYKIVLLTEFCIFTDTQLTGRHRAATVLLEQDNNSFFSSNNFSKANSCNPGTG